jgi:phosphoglucosamine mutase
MGLKFGTDGVRGVAGRDLRAEDALRIGRAAGLWLKTQDLPAHVVMGRDTRRSGTMLGAALAAGFNAAGVDVTALGHAPTGGVSWAARHGEYGLGAVISASHNPAPDNGIKLMAADGSKIPAELEQFIMANLSIEEGLPIGEGIGVIHSNRDDLENYLEWMIGLCPEGLDGLKVVIDGSQGAGYELGPRLFERLGAEVIKVAVEPNGDNINLECGATHPTLIQAETGRHGAAIGIAFDGDADRAVFSDSEGQLINGDRMMAMWCAHWRRHGRLDPTVVVGTVMSNTGFERFMQSQDIEFHRVNVGDKYVSARLSEVGGKVGGEQSGHIIFPEHGPTGDGLVTALELCRVLKREGKTAADLMGDFDNWPQVLVNIEVERKDGWDTNTVISAAIQQAEQVVGGEGRVNVRASGTQPVVRVMVEAPVEADRDSAAEAISSALLAECGGKIYSRVDLTHELGD